MMPIFFILGSSMLSIFSVLGDAVAFLPDWGVYVAVFFILEKHVACVLSMESPCFPCPPYWSQCCPCSCTRDLFVALVSDGNSCCPFSLW